ncbi:putative cytokinesis regulator [Lyophyllum shimeji]|uniref:Cytokinesis regulator n=1 Tax=Lyophyllum shimeji TaxID=47721 RepID=A0A9P3PHI5_LYOSH|nr:putative cytokinesis regulator [Lyophyllum shimeji]
MATIPAPTFSLSREEWPDADFDLPEGEPIHAPSDKDIDDEDWDIELNVGPSKPNPRGAVAGLVAKFEASSANPSSSTTQTFTIRPPASLPDIADGDDDDEGVSTIKATALPQPITRKPQTPIDEDFEDAFALPSDLTQLSLAPLSLNHRSSKHSLEWGDKDQTSSSQSSDAYSSLGFADASPSSNSASSISLPDTETEEDEDNDDLEGLVLPSALFESGHSAKQLTKILEMKKKAQFTSTQVKVATPDPEDDFEAGLVIDDDVDLSPSRLLIKAQQPSRHSSRSNSMPAQRPSALRPPSRTNRAKSPLNPPVSSARQLQKIRLSPSPPLRPPTRSQTFQALSCKSPVPPSSMSFFSSKPGSLRGQKSYSGLKPPTPPSTLRSLTRKASLSSLIEASQAQASGSGSAAVAGSSKARYEEPTAASRAKSHKYSTSRVQEYKVPPTRPSTPSSNPAALRLTMPTQSRLKARPALSGVFSGPVTPSAPSPVPRATSPLPPRPPSTASVRSTRIPSNPQPAAPKVLRRPKRQRTYGDGTELDGFEDLPTDRDKEGKYRVQPKGYGNRIPGAMFSSKSNEKGTIRRKGRRDGSSGSTEPASVAALTPATNTLKRTTARIEFPSKTSSPRAKKKTTATPSPQTRRKPTLIRNLGGNNGPKVVGEMKWNPLTLRWEGNDHVLRDFDSAVGTSTRPALITHLTGSSIGSPVGSFASGARIVGNMIFDPARMCWISTLPPDEDEPDVFANLADDEEDGDWETKGGTIRASLQQPSGSDISSSANTTSRASSADSSVSSTLAEATSPARSHTRTISESGSERGSRGSMVFDIDETFIESCRLAEERHRVEMKGWKSALAAQDVFSMPDRSYLYEIRALATRKY